MDFSRKLKGLAWEMRPWQWYKQVIVFIPLVFSGQFLIAESFYNTFASALAFSLVAGANYVLNDISDREEDRKHPIKKKRPIASGLISVRSGMILSILSFIAGFYVAYSVNTLVLAVIVFYLLQNLAYSYRLKEILFIDITVIAVGFVLRAVAGVFAISSILSPWLIICTFLAALLLAIGKRKEELIRNGSESREVLEEYSEELIDKIALMVASIMLMSYSLYTFSGAEGFMMVTIPFALIGVFRYFYLLGDGVASDPANMIKDRYFAVNLLLWAISIILILYLDLSHMIGMVV